MLHAFLLKTHYKFELSFYGSTNEESLALEFLNKHKADLKNNLYNYETLKPPIPPSLKEFLNLPLCPPKKKAYKLKTACLSLNQERYHKFLPLPCVK
jgi:hypothetical protein